MSTEIVAPMPGTVVEVLVEIGDKVTENQDVIVLESMKMNNSIPTRTAGKVKEIKVSEHDKVASKQVLVIIE
ncbi:MAG: acetyl-CoA carboxylase biotin carboxyl carrier protein subunit [Thermodesulfobacteriota bacterium]|nr:acetyl-CoA carboxylase biotin carboxyl carrier protein subunit [Thermodesulfobacteriota bacterium]